MYAVIDTGGKQYKVACGDKIKIEQLDVGLNKIYEFKTVIMFSDDENIFIGSPYLNNVSVRAKIINYGRHKKLVVYKYKPKKGFHKKKGHRQIFTEIEISEILVNQE